MNRLDAMQLFVRVAELASFTRAADSLNLPKASASLAVQQLETQLGARLLNRTTRRVQMTPDGQSFYERCKDLLADMDELQSMFQQTPQALRGRLRVDMPGGAARELVIPRLPEFLSEHPQIEVELSCTDRRVDLVREGFDCVMRIGTLQDSSLIARPLGSLRIINCVSPSYIAAFGEPRTLEDLPNHRLVDYVSTLGAKSGGFEYFDGEQCHFIDMPATLTVSNTDAYEACCLAGLGIIQLPVLGSEKMLASGRLIEVLKDFPAEPMPVSLLYAHRRHLPQRVKVFMDWLASLMRPHVDPPKH